MMPEPPKPMMSEDELRREMRLIAIDALAANLLATSILQASKNPEALMASIREGMLQTAALPFPEHDPAESDWYASEFEAAVARLLGMAESQMHQALQSHREKAARSSSDDAPSSDET
jgi:hypothetical protein